MKPIIIIANWKMNPVTLDQAEHLFYAIQKGIKKRKGIEVVICPSFVHGPFLRFDDYLKYGVQNCSWEKQGAYTGEVSIWSFKDLLIDYALVGHSERREYFNETDEIVNKKLKAILKSGIRPILCVGEKTRDAFDESGRSLNEMSLIVKEQIQNALNSIPASKIQDIVIAYEPVWAIGSGKNCSPDDAMKAKLLIKKTLIDLYDDRQIGDRVRIIYGGSVDSKNAASYIEEADVDGLLIGGASLNATEFLNIVSKITLEE